MRLERAHAQFLGEGQGLLVVGFGLGGIGGIGVQTWPSLPCHQWGFKATGFGRKIVAHTDRKPFVFQLRSDFMTLKYALKARQA